MSARTPLANRLSTIGGVDLVPFLFGALEDDRMPGVVLNRLLVELGLTSAAARTLVARMKKHGQLESTREGRGVDYRLAGPLKANFERVRDYTASPPMPWTGSFHALHYHVPEELRSYRDNLRRVAVMSGYGPLQQGVLISVTDRRDVLADLLAQCPPGARVYLTELAMELPDAVAVAWHAWDLADVATVFEDHIDTMTRLLDSRSDRPEPTTETLRIFTEHFRGPMRDTLREPSLPVELLPETWPGARFRQLMGQVIVQFGPPAVAYIRGLVAEHDT